MSIFGGDSRDWMFEQWLEVQGGLHVEQDPDPSDYDTWTTREGETVVINDMTNAHLRNCLFMQARKGHALHPGLLDEYEARFASEFLDDYPEYK